MPTILRVDGYEIVIYLRDHLPPHVHVFTGNCEAIINLHCPKGDPDIRESFYCKPKEVKGALEVVSEHQQILCAMWKEIHGNF